MNPDFSTSSFINNECYSTIKQYLIDEINKNLKSKSVDTNLYDTQRLLALTVREQTLRKILEEFSQYER